MKPIILQLKKKLKYRLDMSFLSTQFKNISSLQSYKILYGNKQFKFKDFFSIKGNDLNNIIIKSSVNLMDNIGRELRGMNIKVYGDVGYSFGEKMYSGKLELHGNTLDYAAAGIRGGSLFVYGNTGEYTAGKPNSSNEGVVDGFIYIKGNVGNNSIERMRRGNVIIEGNLGDDACHEMLSGTVIIKGRVGKSFAEGIKRGTIFTKDEKIIQKYNKSNNAEFNFTGFMFKEISKIISKNIFLTNKTLTRYCGHQDDDNLSEIFLYK